MAEKLRLLSLFAGIGGFELGLERSGYFETVAQCEIDPFCRRVLAKHWPNVRRYEDVRELTAAKLAADGIAVDAICGGFPCQDISVAGKGAGLGEGTRSGLWSEFARLISDIRPGVVFVENVANLLSGPSDRPGAWFGRVLGDLATIRYDAEWHCIPASCVGLPHIRDRVWLVAYPWQERGQGEQSEALSWLRSVSWRENERRASNFVARCNLHEPFLCKRRNGLSDELGAYGNAVVPQIPELLGRAYGQAILERA